MTDRTPDPAYTQPDDEVTPSGDEGTPSGDEGTPSGDEVTPSRDEVTRLLDGIERGDRLAAEELLPLLYTELRRLAGAHMAREGPGHTLQPTALVHEAYLRLIKDPNLGWENRRHFFAAAAEAMRRILIERARRYARHKHGAGQRRVVLDDDLAIAEPDAEELLALDLCLDRLEARDETMARVVKLRFFAGLTIDETASALDISPRQIARLWSGARAWLRREMKTLD